MFRRVVALLAAIFLVVACGSGNVTDPPSPHLYTALSLQICFVNGSGECVGGAGWQQETGVADACGASEMYSYKLGYDVSVWIDDQTPDRQGMINCEISSLHRATYHIFVGTNSFSGGCTHFNFVENMCEWYPYHSYTGCSTAESVGQCAADPDTNPADTMTADCFGDQQNGYVTQWYYSTDYPPNGVERQAEWRNAYQCNGASSAPDGHY